MNSEIIERTDLVSCRGIAPFPPTYAAFSKLFAGYLTIATIMLGTVGNIYSIKNIRLSNFEKNRGVGLAISIISLAFWDTVLLWGIFFYYAVNEVLSPGTFEPSTVDIVKHTHFVAQFSNTASIWFVVTITVQRYIASRDPFTNGRPNNLTHHPCRYFSSKDSRKFSNNYYYSFSNIRKLFKLPVIISSIAFLVNVPTMFELETYDCWNTSKHVVQRNIRTTALRSSVNYSLYYRLIFRLIFGTFGPSIFIFCLTALTIRSLKGSNRTRKQLFEMTETMIDQFNSKETMQTVISLVLIIKFLVFRSSQFMLDIWELVTFLQNNGKPGFSMLFNYCKDISNFLVAINSATNCIIFMKASYWIEGKLAKRISVRRKNKPCVFQSLQLQNKAYILRNSWNEIQQKNNMNFGGISLNAMLEADHSLLGKLMRINQESEDLNEDSSETTPLNTILVSVPPSGIGYRNSIHNIGTRRKRYVSSEDSVVSGIDCEKRLNESLIEITTTQIYQNVSSTINNMIDTVINMMAERKNEHEIRMFIRRVGFIHYIRGITFSNMAWKGFKESTLHLVSLCDFTSESERHQTNDAWISFICLIIIEMKMGQWESGITV
uniref:G_PROTEIN_RECEP_F1_2 domain-containing protein n=1 Tax=Parastrongyloides trichosuri TaxID=131310 RepID=A0A0N4ZWC3_PARTI